MVLAQQSLQFNIALFKLFFYCNLAQTNMFGVGGGIASLYTYIIFYILICIFICLYTQKVENETTDILTTWYTLCCFILFHSF